MRQRVVKIDACGNDVQRSPVQRPYPLQRLAGHQLGLRGPSPTPRGSSVTLALDVSSCHNLKGGRPGTTRHVQLRGARAPSPGKQSASGSCHCLVILPLPAGSPSRCIFASCSWQATRPGQTQAGMLRSHAGCLSMTVAHPAARAHNTSRPLRPRTDPSSLPSPPAALIPLLPPPPSRGPAGTCLA